MIIYKSTEKAQNPVSNMGRPPVYDFKGLDTGESLRFDKAGVKVSSLRSAASHYGRRHGKRFSVVTHDEFYEVARVE